MALETGNYISSLVKTNPVSSDNVSEGDDHLQLIKKILKQTFPVGTDSVGPDQAIQVLVAKSSAPTVDTSAAGHAARAMGLLWLDTSNNLLKIRNQANDAWITLAIDPETSNSVDINAGTIDGTTIGATTASTGKFSSVNIAADGATVTGIKDEDDMASDSAVKLATQQSIKAYVDSQVTAQDLDVISDSGTIDIDLDSESLTIAGGSGIDTSATSTTLTIAGEDATTSNKGVASFHSDNFAVSSGAVTIKDAGVADAELADMPANTVKVRDANSTGVPANKTVADTQVLIGDGTGFTAAALSGDATMTNAGAVTVAKIQGTAVSSTAPTNDQYMKYSSSANEWQMVSITGTDKLTTKGDLLVYNTVDSETRLPVGTNKKVVTANSSATNGLDWQFVDGESIRMGSDAAGDTVYFNGTDYARLAKGSASQVLTMNSGATAPEWAAAGQADMAANTVKVRDASSSGAPSDKAVADTQILIGDGTGFTAAALSGDVTMANTGAVAIASGVIVDADINASAAIDATKIANGSVTSTEFQYINTLSSNAQTQLDAKASLTADQAWTGSQRATAVTDNDMSYDMDGGQNFISTPSGNATLTFTNIANGQSGFLKLINSGGHTISLHSNSKADANLATTVSTAGTYLLSYFSDGTDVWLTNSAIYA
jgi:hypothetical protein